MKGVSLWSGEGGGDKNEQNGIIQYYADFMGPYNYIEPALSQGISIK